MFEMLVNEEQVEFVLYQKQRGWLTSIHKKKFGTTYQFARNSEEALPFATRKSARRTARMLSKNKMYSEFKIFKRSNND